MWCCAHIAALIDDFVDCSARWSFKEAVTRRGVYLVTRLVVARDALSTLTNDEVSAAFVLAARRSSRYPSVRARPRRRYAARTVTGSHGRRCAVRSPGRRRVAAQESPQRRLFDRHDGRRGLQRPLGRAQVPPRESLGGCTKAAMDGAAESGRLQIVKWLSENRREGCTTSAMDGAAATGSLDVVRWLHEHRSEGCTTEAMNAAVGEGHLHVVR